MSEPHEEDLSRFQETQYIKTARGWTWARVESLGHGEIRTVERAHDYFPTIELAAQDFRER